MSTPPSTSDGFPACRDHRPGGPSRARPRPGRAARRTSPPRPARFQGDTRYRELRELLADSLSTASDASVGVARASPHSSADSSGQSSAPSASAARDAAPVRSARAWIMDRTEHRFPASGAIIIHHRSAGSASPDRPGEPARGSGHGPWREDSASSTGFPATTVFGGGVRQRGDRPAPQCRPIPIRLRVPGRSTASGLPGGWVAAAGRDAAGRREAMAATLALAILCLLEDTVQGSGSTAAPGHLPPPTTLMSCFGIRDSIRRRRQALSSRPRAPA